MQRKYGAQQSIECVLQTNYFVIHNMYGEIQSNYIATHSTYCVIQ